MSDDEPQVLSSAEVDAILKVTQDKSGDLSKTVGDGKVDPNTILNGAAFKNIAELTGIECEKNIISFLRKKMSVKFKSANHAKVESLLNNEQPQKCVFSVFRTTPTEHYGIFMLELSFLHQIINLLYGGKLEPGEAPMEQPGKVGAMVAEKIAQICLSGFTEACKDYAEIAFQILKTSSLANITSNVVMEDQIYMLEFSINYEEYDTSIYFLISDDLLNEMILSRKDATRHREKDFWRTAIQSQVVDSMVSVSVTLPDTTMKVADFMALHEGDVIPISDPTVAYVCLNNIKLFRAKAGQANNKRVVKILKQI